MGSTVSRRSVPFNYACAILAPPWRDTGPGKYNGALQPREGFTLPGGPMAFTIESPAFAHGAAIPRRCTCDAEDVSPPLRWSGWPDKTRSLALIVDDPDAPDPAAPKRVYVHWVLYDVPTAVRGIEENGEVAGVKAGARQGKNDWDRIGYGGPCPPIGRHRYFFKLYALDAMLGDLGTPTKRDLEKAMQGHVLASAELMGTYQRSG